MKLIAIVFLGLLAANPVFAQQAAEDDEAALLVAEGRAALARKKYDRAAEALNRALAANPRRLDAYLLRAGVHAALREHDRAIALLRRALALAPDSVEVMAALGTQLTIAGQGDEGVTLLEAAVARAPDSYQAQATLGQHYARRGRWREAAKALRAYLRARPGALAGEDATVKAALAEAELRGGDPMAARDLFEELAKDDERNVKARLGAGWAAAAIDCKAAMPRLQELDSLSDRYPEVWLVLGRCRLHVGQLAEARDLADRYLTKRPNEAGGHALRGEAILAGGNPFEARRELARALDLEPRNRRVLMRWARAARESGAPAEAVARLRAERPEESDEPDFTTETGELLVAIGQSAEAIALLQPHVEKYPEDRAARLALGSALVAGGDAASALPHLELAASGTPRAKKLLGEALLVVGTNELSAGNAEAGEKRLARAVELDAGDAALVNLGIARLARGDVKGALPPLERAARTPRNAAALLVYGRALFAAGRVNEAIIALETALSQAGDPARAADIALELAAAEVESADPARAVARLETAISRAPAAHRARLEDALVPAARAAASKQIASGAFSSAVKLLERIERMPGATKGEAAIAVRCDLALAAVAAGDLTVARARLAKLEGARCPLPSPADELLVPILTAASTRPDDRRVDAAIARLQSIGARARGPAQRLSADAARWLAARAAVAALARGRIDKARRYLNLASKVPGPSPELAYDAAVLELESGQIDDARRSLTAIADQVPEAFVALAIVEERAGDPHKALELYRRGAERGAKVEGLDDWIAGKVRLLGSEK